jgi:prevent-host-death family protein
MNVATSRQLSVVGVRELKNHLSSFLDRVKAGEEFTVTEHGRPIARLSAVGADVDRMAELVAAGVIRPAATSRRRLPTKRVQIVGGAALLADQVLEQRD